MSGLHLGTDSRGGKIGFYESKGDGVRICMHKYTVPRGSGVYPPGKFCILDSQIASGAFSGTASLKMV